MIADKSFDLAPLILGGYKKFVMMPALWSVPIVAAAFFSGHGDFAVSLARGVVIGSLDTIIMITGIRKALPYKDQPKKGLAIMRRYRWYRIISASSIIILLLKQGSSVAGAVLGLLLIHTFYIINLTIIAYRLNKAGDAKKGE